MSYQNASILFYTLKKTTKEKLKTNNVIKSNHDQRKDK